MRLLILLFFLSLLTGCQYIPYVNALHDPLYRAENHTSIITVRARDRSAGISLMFIDALVGDLTACLSPPSYAPSLIPCRANATLVTAQCTYLGNPTSEVTCSLPLAVTPQRLISYTVDVRKGNNASVITDWVTYAAGAPLTHASFWGDVGPWETARPVIWRTGTPSDMTNRADKIDWGFVPNSDIPDYRAFTDDLQSVVIPAFYDYTNANTFWTSVFKNVFNIWAGPTGASTTQCHQYVPSTFGASVSTVRAVFDGMTLLHRNEFRDCGSLTMGGGWGTTQTTLGDAPLTLLHEGGHFLFGLADEYEYGYEEPPNGVAISIPKNVSATRAECEMWSNANNLPAAQCVEFGSSGVWRNDDGRDTIMEDRVPTSTWRTLSGVVVTKRFAACLQGNCY